jgi:hypothetical protein
MPAACAPTSAKSNKLGKLYPIRCEASTFSGFNQPIAFAESPVYPFRSSLRLVADASSGFSGMVLYAKFARVFCGKNK